MRNALSSQPYATIATQFSGAAGGGCGGIGIGAFGFGLVAFGACLGFAFGAFGFGVACLGHGIWGDVDMMLLLL